MMIASIPHSVETLAHCFLSPEEIPPAFRVGTCPEERLYLLDGRICTWEGSLDEVSSPICVRQADGTLRRPIIGQVPAMDEAAAMAGLNAAVRAWDHGRGPWPTMSVGARIAAVELFAAEMLKVRQEVVKLLMWEIGKSLDDSSKEFDRTLQYIHKTVEALKDVNFIYGSGAPVSSSRSFALRSSMPSSKS